MNRTQSDERLRGKEHPHGPCECTEACECGRRGPGPAALAVEREGRTMRVCTQCVLSYDQRRTPLTTDAGELARVYRPYDELGTEAFLVRALALMARRLS